MSAKNIVLIGGPGTGKTTQLCKLLLDSVSEQIKSEEVIFLSYNGCTVLKTAEELKKLGISCALTTLPSLCAGLIRAFHQALGFSTPPQLISGKDRTALHQTAAHSVNERMFPTELGYEQEIEKALQQQMRKNNCVGVQDICGIISHSFHLTDISNYFSKLKVVAIDDAQELTYPEWQIIKKWRSLGTVIHLAGDISSSTQIDTPSKKLLEEAYTSLTNCFRSKPWICKFFNQLGEFNPIRNPYNINPVLESKLTSQIYTIRVDDYHQQLEWIKSQTLNCIQANSSVNVGILCRNTKECIQIADFLHKAGITVRYLRTRTRMETIQPLTERVIITTPWDAKGLEFSAVIVPTAIEGIWPYYKENHILARHQFLAAAGRTKSVLFFVVPKLADNKQTTISRYIKEGNIPDLVVHDKQG